MSNSSDKCNERLRTASCQGVRETSQRVTLKLRTQGQMAKRSRARHVLHEQNKGTHTPQWGAEWRQGHPTEWRSKAKAPRTVWLAPGRHYCHGWFSHPMVGQGWGQKPGSESLASGQGPAFMALLLSVSRELCSNSWITLPQVTS